MSAIRGMPGPKGHLLTGSLPAFRRDPLGFFARCARDYGDAVAFRILHLRCCLLNDPKWIGQILVRERDATKKPWDFKELRVALGEGLLTSEGERWERHRRHIQPAFQHARIERYGEIMAARAAERLDRWRDGEERDLHAEMSQITLEVVAEALFGVDIAPETRRIGEVLAHFMERFEAMLRSPLPIPLRAPTPANRRLRRELRALDEVVFRIVRERRRRAAGGATLLDDLLTLREDGDPVFDEREIRDELVTFLLAGHETTALALTWALMLLAQHPEAEARFVREIETVLGGRRPEAADARRLRFTEHVVDEALRLYPPAWGVAREARSPIDVGGFRLPPGTQIFLVQYVTHRDPRFFEEPERFQPERWEPERRSAIPKYAYFPFGGGPRACIGAHFALLEATLVLASVMQRFRVELVADQRIELQPAVTLRPRYGLRAIVRRR